MKEILAPHTYCLGSESMKDRRIPLWNSFSSEEYEPPLTHTLGRECVWMKFSAELVTSSEWLSLCLWYSFQPTVMFFRASIQKSLQGLSAIYGGLWHTCYSLLTESQFGCWDLPAGTLYLRRQKKLILMMIISQCRGGGKQRNVHHLVWLWNQPCLREGKESESNELL